MFPFGTSVGLDELPLNVKLPAAVSTSPTVKPIGPAAVPTAVLWSAIFDMVGGSFTALTVNTKLALALNCPSLTVTVIVAVAFWLGAGLTVTVRFAPEPPKTMFPFGTRAGLDELPLNVKLPAAVSPSPTVKLSAPVDVSSAIV